MTLHVVNYTQVYVPPREGPRAAELTGGVQRDPFYGWTAEMRAAYRDMRQEVSAASMRALFFGEGR